MSDVIVGVYSGTGDLSPVGVCNDALGQIGQPAIPNLTGTTTTINWCRTFYNPLRRALLRAHHWNFAIGREELTQAAPPQSEFAYAYNLPIDFLKVIDYAGSQPSVNNGWWPSKAVQPYKIENNQLVSNDAVAFIKYIKDVQAVQDWDPLFYQFMAKLLAAKLATAILRDFKLSASLKGEAYQWDFAIASAVDGQEGSVEATVVDDLQWGRWHA